MTTLRKYQTESIQNLRIRISAGIKTVCLYAPTGAGKTEIAKAIINHSLAKGKRVAFIANRVELIKQTSKRFADIPHGIIQGDNTFGANSNLIICSIQTVAKRGLPLVDLIIIDECHAVAGSKDYQKLLKDYNNVPVVGLTATPFSTGLGKYFQELVVATSIRDLIDQGYLVDVDIYAPSTPDLTGVDIVAGDYNERQLGVAVDKPQLVGDIVNHWHRLA